MLLRVASSQYKTTAIDQVCPEPWWRERLRLYGEFNERRLEESDDDYADDSSVSDHSELIEENHNANIVSPEPKKRNTTAFGESRHAALELNNEERIKTLREHKDLLKAQAAVKEDRKKQKELLKVTRQQERIQKENEKNMICENQSTVVAKFALLNWLPANFIIGKSHLTKGILLDFIKKHRIHKIKGFMVFMNSVNLPENTEVTSKMITIDHMVNYLKNTFEDPECNIVWITKYIA